MAKVVSFLLLFAFLSAEIIETSRMEDVLPFVDENTWVLFDIDDTLVESELQVGRAKWFFHEVEKLTSQGYDFETAILELYPEWIHLQEVCPIRTPEPQIPQIVYEIQQSAGAVLGVTARHPPISVATLKQLAYIGINFTFTAPECPKLEVQPPVHWEGGVLFLTDFNRKGEIFRKWLEYSHIRPQKVILIDDGKENLIQMEEEMAKMNIPFTGFHYTKTMMRPFDAEIAEKEHLELFDQ